MTKHPTVGKVKTRLGESIGHKEVAHLYLCFLKDTIEKVNRLGIPFFIYYTPKNKKDDFVRLLPDNFTLMPQFGNDLGKKIYHGFNTAFKMDYTSAIALASDVPDLPPSFLVESVNKLKHFDSVMGPSFDGGYYLIGLKKNEACQNLFQGIKWSTESVYTETMKKIQKRKISCYQLTPWRDIDLIEDLEHLQYSDNPFFHKSHTWKYLKDSKII
jgi:rSAM/selenodomain-associated transferase 1